MLKNCTIVITLLLNFYGLATPSAAHDLMGIIDQDLDSASPQIAKALSVTPTADVSTRSVLNNLRLWPIPRKLTICFMSGSSSLRKRVANSMRETWQIENLTEGRLSFDSDSFSDYPDCGATPASDIRVDFRPLEGNSSFVGIESREHTPSMNFAGFTDTLPEQQEFDRQVAHETGHALGLEHEHQSPVSPDCSWDFLYLRTHYPWKSELDMSNNLAKLQDYIMENKHAYIFSTYDRKSVMHYYFESDAFKEGAKSPCFIPRKNIISDQDRDAIQVAYGRNLVAEQVRVRDAAPDLAETFSGPNYDKLRILLRRKGELLP